MPSIHVTLTALAESLFFYVQGFDEAFFAFQKIRNSCFHFLVYLYFVNAQEPLLGEVSGELGVSQGSLWLLYKRTSGFATCMCKKKHPIQ